MRERIYSDGMMNKQTRVFNFQCFSLCYSITPFWHGIFWGLIFGPGFLGFCWKPLGFFWVLTFGSIRASPSLEILSTPLGPHISNPQVTSERNQKYAKARGNSSELTELTELKRLKSCTQPGTMGQCRLYLYNTCDVKRHHS